MKPYTPILDITPVSSIVTGGRRFGVGRGQPRVKRHQRHFHGKAQQHTAENDQRELRRSYQPSLADSARR